MKRYSLLFPRKAIKDLREEMPGILESLRLDQREYQIGKEKVRNVNWIKIIRKLS